MLIAGDLNTELKTGSCVAATLTDSATPTPEEVVSECASNLRLEEDASPSKEQLQAYEELMNMASTLSQTYRIPLNRVDTGPTRSSFEHGKKCGPCVPWKLDHIFYNGKFLRLQSFWEALEKDPDAVASGLPNRWCPSDHIPVGASFEQVLMTPLTDAEKENLRCKVENLQQSQLQRVQAWRIECEAERDRIEQEEIAQKKGYDTQHLLQSSVVSLPDPPPSSESFSKKKQKKKDGKGGKGKKKGRPSERVVEFIRESRGKLKLLQAELSADREAFIMQMNEFEVDFVEELVSGKALLQEWVLAGFPALTQAAKLK